nr:uncharacterized protein LOC111413894 isoform X1 [Onthophagus taurus]
MEATPHILTLNMATNLDIVLKRLRQPESLSFNTYVRLIQGFYRELLNTFHTIDSVAQILLQSLDEQYIYFINNIPPSHHLFEVNMMYILNIDELERDTIFRIYDHTLRGLSIHRETHNILKFLDKLVQKYIVKQVQHDFLRKLQGLVGPSDKKCLKLVIKIACYIVTKWNCDEEQEELFDKLMIHTKWSKLDYYICSSLYRRFGRNSDAVKIVMEKIFQGFQENHSAYGAFILFKEVIRVSFENYYDIIEDDIVSVLEQDIKQRTLRSSIITYVIPTISDAAREKFIKRIGTFNAFYKLQVIKYYCHKDYLEEIDFDLINEIVSKVALNKKDKTVINLIFDLCCSNPNKDSYVEEEHFRLFMRCIKKQYGRLEPVMRYNIHTFLNLVLLSMVRKNRPLYLEFFLELDKLVRIFPNKYHNPKASYQTRVLMEIHVRALYLLSRTYTKLREKFPFVDCEDLSGNRIPTRQIFERYIQRGWDMIKQVTLSGLGTEYAYDLISYNKANYDEVLISGIKTSLFVSLTVPNLDKLSAIRTYAKTIKKIYLNLYRITDIDNLIRLLIEALHQQYLNIKDSRDYLAHLANPVYTTGEAILVFIDCFITNDGLRYLQGLCSEIIYVTLPLIDTNVDAYSKKCIEQIFVTHLEILKHCVIKQNNLEVDQELMKLFFRICDYIMCQTKYRKATSAAVKVASEVVGSISYLSDDIYDYLISRLNTHLYELEDAALNRCSGNKEMILFTFKSFQLRRNLFPIHFQRMLSASHGYHELHLIAITAIISDAKLKSLTDPFLIDVFRRTLDIMAHPKFSNRNLAAQIMQVLANRIMGTKSELGTRPVSLLHVFERFPELEKICFETLISKNNHSKFGVLIFIGESPHCSSLFGEICDFPRDQIGQLLETPGLKMIANKVYAMTVNINQIYSTILKAIQGLHFVDVTPCSLMFVEYLLTRLMNLNVKDEVIQDVLVRLELLLRSPGVMGTPGATKFLRYPSCNIYKVSLKHSPQNDIAEDLLGLICKCFISENYVALTFACFYTGTIFQRLKEVAKEALLQKLVQLLFEPNGGSYLMICQYYLTIKNIIICYPHINKTFVDVKFNLVSNVFVAEIITFILSRKESITERDLRSLQDLKCYLPILFKQSDTDDEIVSESIVSTLINLSNLFPKVDFKLLDFYFLLIVAIFSISDKSRFKRLFKIIIGKDDEISYQIQRLPKIIKRDLAKEYPNFIKNTSKYISLNLNKFFVDYTPLYNCSEEYINVKIDVFLLKTVLEELKTI